nr:formin-like protein 18 [Equus caballus]
MPEARPGGPRGEGASEHSPPPPRSPASSCPGPAPSPCFPSAPLPALSAVSLCAIGRRRCPRPSAPPRTPETRAAPPRPLPPPPPRAPAGVGRGVGAGALARGWPRLGLESPGGSGEAAARSPRETRSPRLGGPALPRLLPGLTGQGQPGPEASCCLRTRDLEHYLAHGRLSRNVCRMNERYRTSQALQQWFFTNVRFPSLIEMPWCQPTSMTPQVFHFPKWTDLGLFPTKMDLMQDEF